jgi:hypothetical protein
MLTAGDVIFRSMRLLCVPLAHGKWSRTLRGGGLLGT